MWIKARKSAEGNCVEMRREENHILVRDSKDENGPFLTFTIEAFRTLLSGVGQDTPTIGT